MLFRQERQQKKTGAKGRLRVGLGVAVLAALPALAGCARDGSFQPISMWNESRLKPYEKSVASGPGVARPLPAGTVARGEMLTSSGRGEDGKLLTKIPFAVTKEVLERGQERFNIYCSPCHNKVGDGQGMIVKRGFPHPPDYALKRLREAPIGHFYEVMTEGYGVMFPYRDKLPANDRWAVAAYVRVLQSVRKNKDGSPLIVPDLYEEERVRGRMKSRGNPNVP